MITDCYEWEKTQSVPQRNLSYSYICSVFRIIIPFSSQLGISRMLLPQTMYNHQIDQQMDRATLAGANEYQSQSLHTYIYSRSKHRSCMTRTKRLKWNTLTLPYLYLLYPPMQRQYTYNASHNAWIHSKTIALQYSKPLMLTCSEVIVDRGSCGSIYLYSTMCHCRACRPSQNYRPTASNRMMRLVRLQHAHHVRISRHKCT